MEYINSFWNYIPLGTYNAQEEVGNWADLGMNCPTSFKFNPEKNDKNEMLKFLDECQKNGMKVIIDDTRVSFRKLLDIPESEYRKGVKAAVEDFCSHPAVFGLHVGDEPYGIDESWGNAWETAARAVKICYEYAPNLKHFINFLPYWKNNGDENNDSFYKATGARTPSEYSEIIKKFIEETGIKAIGYDCYAQCSYFEKEHYKEVYFKNLKLYTDAVKGFKDVCLINSVLSTGHMSLRVPNEDDIRYQISTTVASGLNGFMWFYLYDGEGFTYSFRNSPIDVFHKKTQTYEYLSRQSKIFMKFIAPRLKDYEVEWVKHYHKCYGGFEELKPHDDFFDIEVIENKTPLIITKFVDNSGNVLFGITNNHMSEPTCIRFKLIKHGNTEKVRSLWIAPGQIVVL